MFSSTRIDVLTPSWFAQYGTMLAVLLMDQNERARITLIIVQANAQLRAPLIDPAPNLPQRAEQNRLFALQNHANQQQRNNQHPRHEHRPLQRKPYHH